MTHTELDGLVRHACELMGAQLIRYNLTERDGWLYDVTVWVDSAAAQIRSYLRDRAPLTHHFDVQASPSAPDASSPPEPHREAPPDDH
jgi:hypothetical protein